MPRLPDKKLPELDDAMDVYALRIWEGQSPDLSLKERTERISKALSAQGVENIKDVKLPAKGYERYL